MYTREGETNLGAVVDGLDDALAPQVGDVDPPRIDPGRPRFPLGLSAERENVGCDEGSSNVFDLVVRVAGRICEVGGGNAGSGEGLTVSVRVCGMGKLLARADRGLLVVRLRSAWLRRLVQIVGRHHDHRVATRRRVCSVALPLAGWIRPEQHTPRGIRPADLALGPAPGRCPCRRRRIRIAA
jgi:hypothetical protein